MMTDFTPAQARELSNKLMRLERTATESDTATALRSLADQVEKLTAERAAPKAQVIDMRDGKYLDSTPKLHVGSSSFEDWYQAHEKACTGDKQLARDAYAAGMGDPLVTYAQPPQQSAQPVGAEFPKTIEAWFGFPAAQPVEVQPLTVSEINAAFDKHKAAICLVGSEIQHYRIAVANAIQEAHGIKPTSREGRCDADR